MNKQLMQGIIIMIMSAIFTSIGQLFWKLALSEINFYLLSGFICYGCGAIFMIIAFSKGDISILHPLMSIGYIISMILASMVLKETISIMKLLGIIIIIGGIYIIARGGLKHDINN